MSDGTRTKTLPGKVGLFFTNRDALEPALVTLFAAVFSLIAGVGLIFLEIGRASCRERVCLYV